MSNNFSTFLSPKLLSPPSPFSLKNLVCLLQQLPCALHHPPSSSPFSHSSQSPLYTKYNPTKHPFVHKTYYHCCPDKSQGLFSTLFEVRLIFCPLSLGLPLLSITQLWSGKGLAFTRTLLGWNFTIKPVANLVEVLFILRSETSPFYLGFLYCYV